MGVRMTTPVRVQVSFEESLLSYFKYYWAWAPMIPSRQLCYHIERFRAYRSFFRLCQPGAQIAALPWDATYPDPP